jgi:Arf-GAP/coiled-coil/ANK repeat/PH domain-containing protein
MLATQLESVFSVPMEAFVREDIREVKEEAKRYDKARGIYDSTCGKMGQLKKKDTSKIAEVEHELELSKQQFQLQGLEFVYKMNELQLKKKIEFLERVCAFMFGQLSFFHTGYQMFSEMEPYMRGLTVKLQQVTFSPLPFFVLPSPFSPLFAPFFLLPSLFSLSMPSLSIQYCLLRSHLPLLL